MFCYKNKNALAQSFEMSLNLIFWRSHLLKPFCDKHLDRFYIKLAI